MDDRVLLHQVHPLKLAADISASLISNTLLWRHRLVAGIVTRYALPIAGSAIVLSAADVERLRGTAAGRYVLANISPAAMAVRLAGDVVIALGSWHRRPRLIALGFLIVVVGWSRGLLRDQKGGQGVEGTEEGVPLWGCGLGALRAIRGNPRH